MAGFDIFANEMNCEECLNSRRIISEGGYHSVCTLSAAKMRSCITGRESFKKLKTKGNYIYGEGNDKAEGV